MIDFRYLLFRIQDVKIQDYLSVFPMIGGWIASLFYRKKYRYTWLICEEKKEARDNGYWFFRKMRENHPEQQCIYAIDKKSVDYSKVRDLGEVISFGSIRHWIIYFTCQYNISSQKGGKPNAAICSFLELNNWHNAHNVFLQHGITINNVRCFYADRSRFDIFVTSAVPEDQYIRKNFGYPDEVIKLTGMPRFDNLHQHREKKNRILVMPSWRSWFNEKSAQTEVLNGKFMQSKYLKGWKEFLESNMLDELIQKYGLEVIFYPHRNLQYHLGKMKQVIHTKAVLASWEDYDVQELMLSSSLMITDYSSVFFDMVYMKKHVIFYQFDLEDFRKGHLEQGYFDYGQNPFGNSYVTPEEVLIELEQMIENDFACSAELEMAHAQYFPYYDTDNSERIYDAIRNCLSVGNEVKDEFEKNKRISL